MTQAHEAPAPESLLAATGLACLRGDRLLFRDLSLRVDAGQALQVRGPNGCGKTTLLRILCGLTLPEEGTIRWRGRVLGSHDPDYPHCSFSITMESTDEDGLLVEKTLTLRKEPPAEKASPISVGQKKADPHAKVRNRGKVIFPSTNAKVKDNKDHFPINDANQARNALSRVAQFDTIPKWWVGSLRQLQAAVRNAVKLNFRSINVTEANAGNQGFALFYTTGSFRWLIKEN